MRRKFLLVLTGDQKLQLKAQRTLLALIFHLRPKYCIMKLSNPNIVLLILSFASFFEQIVAEVNCNNIGPFIVFKITPIHVSNCFAVPYLID